MVLEYVVLCSLSKPENSFSHIIISATQCPMKSTRTTMEGWEKKHWTSRLINSTQREFCFAAEPLYTYAYLSLTNTSIYTSHTHKPSHTHAHTQRHYFKVRLLTAAASHDLPAKKEKRQIAGRKVWSVKRSESMHLGCLWTFTIAQFRIMRRRG